MNATITRKVTCRSKTHDLGVPWKCDRPQGHKGKHAVHYPGSRTVVKSWTSGKA